jgi:hypothetical protein
MRMIGLALVIVVLAGVASSALAMSFTDAPGVICGSEELARRHHYEWDNNLPFTVFQSSPNWNGGPYCSINLVMLLHPEVTLVVRHGAFCGIHIYVADPVWTDAAKRGIFWVACGNLNFGP